MPLNLAFEDLPMPVNANDLSALLDDVVTAVFDVAALRVVDKSANWEESQLRVARAAILDLLTDIEETAHTTGYDSGYDRGHADGYDEGHAVGYMAGLGEPLVAVKL